jgi:type IV secretory pathway VirD2 relaxase
MRVARRVPEVMVKITGRTRDAGHLQRHLDYISRNGKLVLEGPDGERLEGRAAVRTLAEDWAAELAAEPGRRRDAPVSLSVVLSMPGGTDPLRVRDSARAFAAATFGERFPWVFGLHTDDRHPHVHLTVRMLGQEGERLNPRKADLQAWREGFAQALRARGVEAEATPRRARGVVRKPERIAVRKLRERYVAGDGPIPRVLAGAAAQASRAGDDAEPWLDAVRERQLKIRRALVAEALELARSEKAGDRAAAEVLERFVRTMPAVETQRNQITRRLGGKDHDVDHRPERPRRR